MPRLGAWVLLLLLAPAASAQPAAKKGPLGKSTGPAASFTVKPAGSDAFRCLPEKTDVHAGDLLVGLPGAGLETQAGVALKSLADFDNRSPLPVFETAVVLNDTPGVDLDFTLDRGRVDVTNTKPRGAAVVVIRFGD